LKSTFFNNSLIKITKVGSTSILFCIISKPTILELFGETNLRVLEPLWLNKSLTLVFKFADSVITVCDIAGLLIFNYKKDFFIIL
jgi:hypothetical protein